MIEKNENKAKFEILYYSHIMKQWLNRKEYDNNVLILCESDLFSCYQETFYLAYNKFDMLQVLLDIPLNTEINDLSHTISIAFSKIKSHCDAIRERDLFH